jgi:hypothetical protein
MRFLYQKKYDPVFTPSLSEGIVQNSLSGQTGEWRKTGDSGIRQGSHTYRTPGTITPHKRTIKAKNTGLTSAPEDSGTDIHDNFTDYDAIEVINRILLERPKRER